MQPRFREDKATQAAALLLEWAGGAMNYMKLVKLLYLADRTALLRWGRPITFARAVSMKHGPVLSEILDLINEGSPPGEASLWNQAVSSPSNYEVRLNAACSADDLSDAEEGVLAEIFREFGGMDPWLLVDRLHRELPEWTPTSGAVPIQYRDILLKEGRTEAAVVELEGELEELAMVDRLLAADGLLPA
ncbi:MAG TPA: Panacea domain-containing protein [Longimicrobium sp.]|jgi:uncharacterized phage-associated protein|nr:Panacea domain-containing protein [Longimicrobium sp.]